MVYRAWLPDCLTLSQHIALLVECVASQSKGQTTRLGCCRKFYSTAITKKGGCQAFFQKDVLQQSDCRINPLRLALLMVQTMQSLDTYRVYNGVIFADTFLELQHTHTNTLVEPWGLKAYLFGPRQDLSRGSYGDLRPYKA